MVSFWSGRGGLLISHLMFVDDLLLVGRASEEQLDMVMDVLNLFCKASGQDVSVEKTNIYFSKNVPDHLRQQLVMKSGFVETNKLGKYRGSHLWVGLLELLIIIILLIRCRLNFLDGRHIVTS